MHRRSPAPALLLVAGLTACGGADAVSVSDDGTPQVPASAGHVHGIGIDDDGRVLLGTHGGAMAVEDDAVRHVGRAATDLMGFVVAADGTLWASGHPGPGDDLPEPVGLLRSTDGGQSWEQLSRGGQSDFHALAAGDGVVYGFDGVLRRTEDGRTWTEPGGDVLPASLAVDPADGDLVLATTQAGPVRSTDGGATFSRLADAPLLVFLAWTTPDDLWGVAPDGAVHHSADGGTSWHRTGSAGGPPQAFTADGSDTVVVALEDRLVRSTDAGETFEVIALRE